jgi:hypothetical protein
LGQYVPEFLKQQSLSEDEDISRLHVMISAGITYGQALDTLQCIAREKQAHSRDNNLDHSAKAKVAPLGIKHKADIVR